MYFKKHEKTWRLGKVILISSITPTSELGEKVVSNKETSVDGGIPPASRLCADQSDQEEAIGDESEISRKSTAGK